MVLELETLESGAKECADVQMCRYAKENVLTSLPAGRLANGIMLTAK